MDPSPYEDNYLVHLCFHYVEKSFFFSLPPTFYFPSQNTRVLYFLIFNPLATGEGNPKQPSSPGFLADGNLSLNSGAEGRGMVMSVGSEWHHDGAQDKVRRRMEERGGTEPGELNMEPKYSKMEYGADGKVEAAQGENTERTHLKHQIHPCIFGRNPNNQGNPRPAMGKWSPGMPVAPRAGHWAKMEPRLSQGFSEKDGMGSQGKTSPVELPDVAPTHGLTTGKASPNCLRLCFPPGSLTP